MTPANRRRCTLLVLACGLAAGGARTEEADPHAAHRAMMAPASAEHAVRSEHDYTPPDLQLVRDDGTRRAFAAEIDDGRPVYLNFIYTTCTTICPLSSQIFSQLERKLGSDSGKVHLVSISIDPEQDTPARLLEYGRKFHAGPEWQHYTGTVTESLTVQRAFDVYKGDKMRHTPVTFFRAAPGKRWVRLDGFASADELLEEYRESAVKN